MKIKIRHSDIEVIEWAEIYVDTCKPLDELEQQLKVSHSTLWWCFMHRLPKLNNTLYLDVLEMIELHKRIKG